MHRILVVIPLFLCRRKEEDVWLNKVQTCRCHGSLLRGFFLIGANTWMLSGNVHTGRHYGTKLIQSKQMVFDLFPNTVSQQTSLTRTRRLVAAEKLAVRCTPRDKAARFTSPTRALVASSIIIHCLILYVRRCTVLLAIRKPSSMSMPLQTHSKPAPFSSN